MPTADDYLSLNLYTNAMLLKSRAETTINEFDQVYATNRGLMSQATGFDPITTAPTDPGNPNPAASEAAKKYALLLGGAANALNAVIQGTGQNVVGFNVLGGFIADMQDCRLDGVNPGGPAQYLFLGAQRNMPTDLNLNLEITRFRNNNFARYNGISASLDQTVCGQPGAVPDTQSPVITLLGDNPLTLEGGGMYTDAGFTAADDRDGDVTANVTVSGTVNTSSVTTQTVTFSVSDMAGNVGSATRTVNVVDTTPPALTLNGTTPVRVLINTSYTDSLGASAQDAVDGDLTGSIVSVNPVDVNTPGIYTITYDVTDGAGNAAAQISRVVEVVDTDSPVITVNGNSPQAHEAGTPYIDAGATAIDTIDGDLTASIVTINNVNASAGGTYTVTYDVSDSSGNAALQEVRTVIVGDSNPPVITLTGSNPQAIEAASPYVELGATASDSLEGDLTAAIVINASAVDTSTPGRYLVTYDVSDGAGNAAVQLIRTIEVSDTSAPVLTLNGSNPQTVEANTAYTELGATANDSVDGDLSANVVINTTALNPSTPGSYVVTYNVSDAAGNAAAQLTRTVNVVDTTPPVITLAGANPQTLEVLSAYTELSATASDTLDGDVTGSIVIDASSVDTSTPGAYAVTYNVTDAAGNAAAQVTRTVNVQDTTPPIITLIGANPQLIEAPDPYGELGATASDSLDGDLTAAIVVNASAVDTSTPGSYLVTYNVSDAAGNPAAQVTRTVTVTDTGNPIITLIGAATVSHEAATLYSDAGATANDAVDGDLSASITLAGTVDVNVPGSYALTFDVSDSSGNAAAQVTRTVNVADTTSPLITLLGNASESVAEDSPYVDAGATASDTLDGDLTAALIVNNPVNTAVPGDYTVTFDVSDAAGNPAATVSRLVTVTPVNDAPILVSPIGDQNAAEGDEFNLDVSVSFSDEEGDALSFSVAGLPVGTGLTLNAGTGVLSGTPTAVDAAASPLSLTVTASDPSSESATDVFTLTVVPQVDVDVDIIADEYAPAPGNVVTFTITLENFDLQAATNLEVVVIEPPELTFGTASPGTGSWDPATFTWQVPNLAGGGEATLALPATLDPLLTEGTEIKIVVRKTAQLQGDPDDVDEKSITLVVVNDGTTYTWLGGDAGGPNDWSIPGNWSPAGIPALNDEAIIPDGLADYPILMADLVLAELKIEPLAQFDLNGQTLTVVGSTAADGSIFGPGLVRISSGTVEGQLPDTEFAGTIDVSDDVFVNGNLTLTAGSVHLAAHSVTVSGNFLATGSGVLEMHHGTDELIVAGDVTFSGGDSAVQIDNNAPMRDGTIYVGGNFIQDGDPRSFAAEDKHRVVFNGSGVQTVTMTNPDNSNPAPGVPAASGSRFAILEVQKDGDTDGAVLFLTDVAVLNYLESTPAFTPVLQGTGTTRLITGGAHAEGVVFDNLPVEIIDGGDFKLVTDLVFRNMNPNDVQLAVRRPDLKNLSAKTFRRLDFLTLPNTSGGGAYMEVENTDPTDPPSLVLTIANSLPKHGTPWSRTLGDFTLAWGTANKDTDKDGVKDADEFTNGLDPRDPDWDDDGLLDGDELYDTGTDPKNSDSDTDGLGDGVEFDIGSNPLGPTANVFYMDAIAGDDSNGGTSWVDAVQTNAGMFGGGGPLDGLNGSPADPVYVLYAAGTYDMLILTGRNDIVLTGSLGPGSTRARELVDTFFDGVDADRVLDLDDSTGIGLRHMRLANGRLNGGGDASGAGLRVAGALGSSAMLYRVEIVDNYADRNGGGFFVDVGSALDVSNSFIARNTARGRAGSDWGGGGGSAFGSLNLNNVVFAENSQIDRLDPEIGGGGLTLRPAVGESVTITESLFLSNDALGAGGGMFIDQPAGSITIKNNLFLGNVSEQDVGGGIALAVIPAGATVRIESNTVAYNQVLNRTDAGGGIDVAVGTDAAELRDNIVWFNDDATLGRVASDNFFDHGSSALVEFNNLQNDPTLGSNNNFSSDPKFERGFYLRSESTSDDAGSATAVAAGLSDPFTTNILATPDTGVLDLGFHYRAAAAAEPDSVLITAETATCGPDTYTVEFAPLVNTPDLGPAHTVEVELGDAHTAGGALKALTSLQPYDDLGTVMAVDQGDGTYRVSIEGVSFSSGESVELELRIDDGGATPLIIIDTDLGALFAAAGC